MHPWAWLIVYVAGSWAVALLVGRWLAVVSAAYPSPRKSDEAPDDEERPAG